MILVCSAVLFFHSSSASASCFLSLSGCCSTSPAVFFLASFASIPRNHAAALDSASAAALALASVPRNHCAAFASSAAAALAVALALASVPRNHAVASASSAAAALAVAFAASNCFPDSIARDAG